MRDHRIEITVDLLQLPEAAMKDPILWYVGCHGGDGRESYHPGLSHDELAGQLTTGATASLSSRVLI